MTPAPAPTATSAAVVDDALIEHYATLVTERPHDALLIVAEHVADRGRLGELLRHAASRCGPGNSLRASLAANPNSPADWLVPWARDGVGDGVGWLATLNPSVASHAEELWATMDHQERKGLLGNPGVAGDFLAVRWREHPNLAGANPALPARLIDEVIDAGGIGAYSHPQLGDDRLAAALRSDLPRVRVAAVANPAATVDQLEHALQASRVDRVLGGSHLASLTTKVAAMRARTDPGSTPTHLLGVIWFHAELARTIVDADIRTDGAVAALLRNQFDGTVAELIAVADGIVEDSRGSVPTPCGATPVPQTPR
jgi:hypothetical protein